MLLKVFCEVLQLSPERQTWSRPSACEDSWVGGRQLQVRLLFSQSRTLLIQITIHPVLIQSIPHSSINNQDRRGVYGKSICLLLLAECWRLQRPHSRQTCTSALPHGQCKERQPHWEGRSCPRQNTSSQPGHRGEEGRGGGVEYWQEPVKCVLSN